MYVCPFRHVRLSVTRELHLYFGRKLGYIRVAAQPKRNAVQGVAEVGYPVIFQRGRYRPAVRLRGDTEKLAPEKLLQPAYHFVYVEVFLLRGYPHGRDAAVYICLYAERRQAAAQHAALRIIVVAVESAEAVFQSNVAERDIRAHSRKHGIDIHHGAYHRGICPYFLYYRPEIEPEYPVYERDDAVALPFGRALFARKTAGDGIYRGNQLGYIAINLNIGLRPQQAGNIQICGAVTAGAVIVTDVGREQHPPALLFRKAYRRRYRHAARVHPAGYIEHESVGKRADIGYAERSKHVGKFFPFCREFHGYALGTEQLIQAFCGNGEIERRLRPLVRDDLLFGGSERERKLHGRAVIRYAAYVC